MTRAYYATLRDLATRHEKALHIDQYSPPDRALELRTSTSAGTLSPVSPPLQSAPTSLQPCWVEDAQSQTNTSVTYQHAEHMPEDQTWTALLGLDAFAPFGSDGLVDGLAFEGSHMNSGFHLYDMKMEMLIEPSITPRQPLYPAPGVHGKPNLGGSRQPALSTTASTKFMEPLLSYGMSRSKAPSQTSVQSESLTQYCRASEAHTDKTSAKVRRRQSWSRSS
jgi:hypothetical protein